MSETLTNHEMYLFFLLGLVIGSFLNTVIYRLPFMFEYEKGESAFKKFNEEIFPEYSIGFLHGKLKK